MPPLVLEDGWSWLDLPFAVRREEYGVGELVVNLPCFRCIWGGLSRGEHFREKQCNKFGSLIQNQSIFRFLNSRFCSLYGLKCQAESEDCLKCFKDLSPQKLALHCYL